MFEPDADNQIQIAPGVRIDENTLNFAFTRATGPGGQNVNKRSTRVELRIALSDIPLPERQMTRLRTLAASRLIAETDDRPESLLIASEVHRTQRRNRADCLQRLRDLIVEAQAVPKPRKKTRPSRGARERRLKEKKEHAQRKQRRQKPDHD